MSKFELDKTMENFGFDKRDCHDFNIIMMKDILLLLKEKSYMN